MTRKIHLIATEESGDRLGAPLMRELKQRFGDDVVFSGVGGSSMAGEGLQSLFPIEELSIIGLAVVVKKLPLILKLIARATEDVLRTKPDVLVIIDSPDFTQRVARRVHRRDPSIPIVNYVSPTVWAWRPGRAKAMRGYIDHVLALLPFEPDAHRRLGGPPCTYIGHPLIERIDTLRPNAEEQARREGKPPVLLVLPGSRRSEIRHHMATFGATLDLLQKRGEQFELILPTMPHLVEAITEALKTWPVKPRVVIGETEKRAAFRIAYAALAKSGTVTLEVALAGVPMVTAYKGGSIEASIIRRFVTSSSVILANLVIGENVITEFIQQDCTPDKLAAALQQVLDDTPMRQRQITALARLDGIMGIGRASPSRDAAAVIADVMERRRF